MRRWIAVVPLTASLLAACSGSSATPGPSLPTAPLAQPGWSALGSVASSRGEGLVGLQVNVAGRPLALAVTCIGDGTLAVSYGASGALDASGQPGAMFPCTKDGADDRFELPAGIGAGQITFEAGIVPAHGTTGPTQFVMSVEQAD